MSRRLLRALAAGCALLACCNAAAQTTSPSSAPSSADALDQLIDRVKAEARSERRHNEQRLQRFLAARGEQRDLVKQAEADAGRTRALADQLRASYERNQAELQALDGQLAEQSGELTELFEVARQLAGDAAGLTESSIVSVQSPQRREVLTQIASGQSTPSLDDIEQLWIALLEEIRSAGTVERFDAPVIHPDGTESVAEVTRVGTFNLIADGRYLKYVPTSRQIIELARQPAGGALAAARGFEAAQDGIAPFYLDPSRGAILGLLVRKPDAAERVRQGGVIGYVILLLGAVAVVVVIYRFFWLLQAQRRIDGAIRMGAPLEAAKLGGRDPISRLRAVYAEHWQEPLEALGVQLNERLGQEQTRLRQGLSTLAVLAAVSPLLGLLGTVTGMIDTFQTITLFGTGDPKLMSGGISQALVTTQLGLAVAIPVLLAHSFLEGRADGIAEQLTGEASDLISRHEQGHGLA